MPLPRFVNVSEFDTRRHPPHDYELRNPLMRKTAITGAAILALSLTLSACSGAVTDTASRSFSECSPSR
jgi:hypothetical protein